MPLLLVILLLMLLSPLSPARDLYVNSTGSPPCDDTTPYLSNTESNPWCTLLRATWGRSDGNRNGAAVFSEAAQAGDTVYVTGDQLYDHETFQYDDPSATIYELANDGAPGSWIKVEAVGTVNLRTNYIPGPPWYREGECAPMIGATGSAARYIWLDGFTITQTEMCYRRGRGVVNVSDRADHFKLTNSRIVGTDTDYGDGDQHNGLLVIGPNTASVCDATISNIEISNNIFTGFTGHNHNDSGITLYCLGDNVLIEHNDINSNGSGIYAKSSFDESNNIRLRFNLFTDNVYSGIRMQAHNDWQITQNIFARNGVAGFQYDCNTGATFGQHPSDSRLVNNTIHENTYGVYMEGLCDNLFDNFVRNNILSSCSFSGIRSEGAACEDPVNINPAKIDYDYNAWEASPFWSDDGGGTVEPNLAGFQSTYSMGLNSSDSTDCLYANEPANDFRLCTAVGVPHESCPSASPCLATGPLAGVDILDLNNNGQTDDPIALGAYVRGDEIIGPIPDAGLPTVGALFLIRQ